jgi:hypothetical protein
MTLVYLLKATTDNSTTHSYTLKVHGSDGLIRTRTIKIKDSDTTYGKLRMSGFRYAMRETNYGPFTLITEEAYRSRLDTWSVRS